MPAGPPAAPAPPAEGPAAGGLGRGGSCQTPLPTAPQLRGGLAAALLVELDLWGETLRPPKPQPAEMPSPQMCPPRQKKTQILGCRGSPASPPPPAPTPMLPQRPGVPGVSLQKLWVCWRDFPLCHGAPSPPAQLTCARGPREHMVCQGASRMGAEGLHGVLRGC